jgi:hypothetical protein
VQQINHDRRETRAILYWRGHVFREVRARLGAAFPAKAGMGPVFRDNQGLRFGEVEHLPRGMARGHRPGEGAAASRTGLGEMVDGRIGGFDAAQRLAGMAFLAAGPLARAFAQAAGAGRLLLQTVAGRGFAAVAAVQSKLTFQFGVPRL